jgi:hypothetical protein
MPLPAAQLKETLRFLDSGTRGFYARVEGRQNDVTLRVGDKVFAVKVSPQERCIDWPSREMSIAHSTSIDRDVEKTPRE